MTIKHCDQCCEGNTKKVIGVVVGNGADTSDSGQGSPLWMNDIWAETWMRKRQTDSQVKRKDVRVFLPKKIANAKALRQEWWQGNEWRVWNDDRDEWQPV